MSLLGRIYSNKYIQRLGRDTSLPERYKPFITQQQYKALVRMIVAYFDTHRPDHMFLLKDGGLLIVAKKSLRQKEFSGHQASLDVSVRTLAEVDMAEWPEYVYELFESMKNNARAARYLVTDYENAAPHLRVMIKSEELGYTEVEGEMIITQHFPGTRSLLALHYDDQFRLLLKDEIEEWGLSEKELFEQALYNAAKDPCEWKKDVEEGKLDCYVMYTAGFSAARLINIEQNDPHLIGDAGAFIAIPSNSMAFAIPVNSQEEASLAFKEIMELAGAAYQDEPGPIIFDVFYYTDKYTSMKDTILRLYPSFYKEVMNKDL